MSSNYDVVLVAEGVEFPGFDGAPSQYEWQTKSFPDSAMRWHRLTADGRLYRANHDYENGLPAAWGDLPSARAVARGEAPLPFDDWIRVRYSGTLRLIAETGDDYIHYDVAFKGPYEVADITRVTNL